MHEVGKPVFPLAIGGWGSFVNVPVNLFTHAVLNPPAIPLKRGPTLANLNLTPKQFIALKNAQEAIAVLCNTLGPYNNDGPTDNLRFEAKKAGNRLGAFQ